MLLDPAYSRYADFYDLIGQRRFGEAIVRASMEWLAERDVHPTTVVDLACGTGAASRALSGFGLTVTGVDRSAAMLDQARIVNPPSEPPTRWLQQDIRKLELDTQFDLATCFYDAVNYLSSDEELAEFALGVARVLHPGGWLVFDFNSRKQLEDAWDRVVKVVLDDDQQFLMYRSWFEKSTGLSPMIVTGFVKRPDGAWDRFDEEHIERSFAIEDVAQILSIAGFGRVEIFEFHEDTGKIGLRATEDSRRVIVFAQLRDPQGIL